LQRGAVFKASHEAADNGEVEAPTAKKTMFQIESEARWRVWALFGLLLLMVYACVWVMALIAEAVIDALNASNGTLPGPPSFALSLPGAVLILLGSAGLAVLYWFLTRAGARDHLIRVMHARALDPDDRFHQRLADIVEEMRIAAGGPAIRCLTVPTQAMNAFAFSDLHGGACIGVTEGALSRLSRAQLEAVVAHEFGHVMSGDYVTVTSACLLFGVFTSLGGGLQDAGEDSRSLGPIVAGGVLWLLVWMLQLCATVINGAISRQREWLADLAAARYTRDPLSLAQALQMMVSHPGGGYLPDGLSALCITPTDQDNSSWLSRAMATHPPVADRIAALLKLAHVDAQQFKAQAAAAETAFEQREHITTAPAAAADTSGAERLTQLVAGPLMAAAPAAAPLLGAAALASPGAAPLGRPAAPVATPAAVPVAAPVAPPMSPVAAPAAAATAAPAAPAASPHHVGEIVASAPTCPGCGAGLERADYEGTTVLICRACGGRLATTPQVQRILTRREMRFDDRQQALAEQVIEHGDELRRDFARRRAAQPVALAECPRCGRTMVRRHFSYDQAVEVDYCSLCDLFWFERDELEVLQVIVEKGQQ
jgi:Zn-dependent protease with chaperone function/Zn-finger nucleic acid-binding protein